MNKLLKLYNLLKKEGLSPEHEEMILRELDMIKNKPIADVNPESPVGLYDWSDNKSIQDISTPEQSGISNLKTLDDLIEHDNQREKDGFPKRIKIGKLIRPGKGNKSKIVVVPTTNEPKFYHDDSITEDGEGQQSGGAGEGEEGEVIGESPAQPQPGEGEAQGAGQGGDSNHDVSSEAFDLGKMLTEKFKLPNIKDKGKKPSLTKYKYDLTDKNKGFGQLIDKKATLRKIIQTNILLGRINKENDYNTHDLLISPQDHIYRILSKEKDYESQAVVFFLRDYSGSMQGRPTEIVSSQHLMIYSWLMYQYQNNVVSRFILHDTEAKEVDDFYTYYQSQVAGGTKVASAFQLVNKIVYEEQLAKDYNIYIFYGTDGDDWDTDGKELIPEIKETFSYINRCGITIVKNMWGESYRVTTVEKNLDSSGLLKEKPELIKLDVMVESESSEERIIEGIKRLVEENKTVT